MEQKRCPDCGELLPPGGVRCEHPDSGLSAAIRDHDPLIAMIREAAFAFEDFPNPKELTHISLVGTMDERRDLANRFSRAADKLYKIAMLLLTMNVETTGG